MKVLEENTIWMRKDPVSITSKAKTIKEKMIVLNI